MLRIESESNADTLPTVYIEGNKANSAPLMATLVELRSNAEFRGKGIHMTTAGSNTRWFAGVPYNFGGSGYQIGYDGSANGQAYTPASASLFINTSRNVGIGTTSPSTRLHVNGGATTLQHDAAILNIYGTTHAFMQWYPTASAGRLTYLGFPSVGTTDFYIANESTNGNIYLLTNSTNRLFITSSTGNIGINTINTYQKLTVVGAIEAGSNASTNGGAFLYRAYSGNSNDYINVIGSEYSSGAMTLGYGAVGKSGALGYVSTFGNFSADRSILNIAGGTLTFLHTRAAVNTAVNSDLSMTASFTISTDGNVTINKLSGSGDRLVAANSTGLLSAVNVGSGLSLSGGTLTATGGATGTVTGTGANGLVSYWTSTSNVTGSPDFTWDNSAKRLGVNQASAAHTLDVNGTIRSNNAVYLTGLSNTAQTNIVSIDTSTGQLYYTASSALLGSSTIVNNNSLTDENYYRILKPLGGYYNTTTATVTGAIKIKYPVGWTRTMHSVRLTVFEYLTNSSFTICFGGYNYYDPDPSTGFWANCFAYIESNSQIDTNYTVRFGYDGTNIIVYIGELTDTWNYPQVHINEVSLGFSGLSSAWTGAWNISFETSAFANQTANITNTQVNSFIRNGSDIYYTRGNVGIATASPNASYKLHVAGRTLIDNGIGNGLDIDTSIADGTTRDAIYLYENDSQATGRQAISWYNGNLNYYKARLWTEVGSGYNATTFGIDVADDARTVATRLAIRNGKVGIGTTDPQYKLVVSNAGAVGMEFDPGTVVSGRNLLINYNRSTSAYTELQIQASTTILGTQGNVGINTTTPAYRLDVNGSARISSSLAVGNITPSATVGRIDASNDVVAFSTSDMRFKTNITPISGALDKITQIGGYEFDWVPNEEHHGFKGHDVGVIAQEIEKVLPEVVKERDSGYKAVKYEKIVPLLIEAIKEQQQQIDELRYLLQNKT
jgi:hypothetical protein